MGRGLYQSEPVFRQHVDHCCELLKEDLGFDLREALFPAEAHSEEANARLMETAVTQPALFVVEYALAQLWMEWGIRPRGMGGHSIGEYVAACLAGVFSLEDALQLVAKRGRLMQELPRGSMLAVPLPETEVRGLLSSNLDIAAVNEVGACVVAGPSAAVESLAGVLQKRGVECRNLKTSHAFHSGMMDPILDEFEKAVGAVERHAPRIPFVSNTTGKWITAEDATSAAYWARHIRGAVRFVENIGELTGLPDAVFLEVGPGQTLSGLVRRHPSRAEQPILRSLPAPQEKKPDVETTLQALGQIWLLGGAVDWKGFHAQEKLRRVPLPTYPFERQHYWMDRLKTGEFTAAAGAAANRGRNSDVADWFSVPMWKQSVAPVAASTGDEGPWLIFSDEAGIATHFAQHLKQADQSFVTVTAAERFEKAGEDHFKIRPAYLDDYSQVLRALRASRRTPRCVAHFWGVTRNEAADLERQKERGFWSLLALAQVLAEHAAGAPVEMRVITTGCLPGYRRGKNIAGQGTGGGTCARDSGGNSEPALRACGHHTAILGRTTRMRLFGICSVSLMPSSHGLRGRVARSASVGCKALNRCIWMNPVRDRLRCAMAESYLITGGLGGVGLALAQLSCAEKACQVGADGPLSAAGSRDVAAVAGGIWQ